MERGNKEYNSWDRTCTAGWLVGWVFGRVLERLAATATLEHSYDYVQAGCWDGRRNPVLVTPLSQASL